MGRKKLEKKVRYDSIYLTVPNSNLIDLEKKEYQKSNVLSFILDRAVNESLHPVGFTQAMARKGIKPLKLDVTGMIIQEFAEAGAIIDGNIGFSNDLCSCEIEKQDGKIKAVILNTNSGIMLVYDEVELRKFLDYEKIE
jgi:hypothetical protein